MLDLEKILGVSLPDEIPEQPPVLKVTQGALVTKLRGAACFLTLMADQVEQRPWGDNFYDQWSAWAGKLLNEADEALTAFRASRDCEGQA